MTKKLSDRIREIEAGPWAIVVPTLIAEIEKLEQQLASKQAEVDALMLEYCPSEMSQEQLDNWAAHQRPSEWKTNDELRKQLAELLDWQQKAFAAHPNIDIDIDRLNSTNDEFQSDIQAAAGGLSQTPV